MHPTLPSLERHPNSFSSYGKNIRALISFKISPVWDKTPEGSEWVRTLPARGLCWISAGKGAQNVVPKGKGQREKDTECTSPIYPINNMEFIHFQTLASFLLLPQLPGKIPQNFFNLSLPWAFPWFPGKLSGEFWFTSWEIFIRLLRATAKPEPAELGAAQMKELKCRICQRQRC